MSSILNKFNCFGSKSRIEKQDNLCSSKSSSSMEKTKGKCDCQCPCCSKYAKYTDSSPNCSRDQTDGKSFSKSLHISKKTKKSKAKGASCCESMSVSDASSSPGQYSTLPSPADPNSNTNTFFIPMLPQESYANTNLNTNLPGRSYMPVSKNDPNYNMNHLRRGKAIIFNFDRWDNTNIPYLDLSPRLGSKKDKKDLANCLRGLDFDVHCYDNVDHLQLAAILDEVRVEDHTDSDCLVVAVMTHGEKNTVYMRDGTQIPINLIWEYFEAHKCPSLAAKPKIFIVQACRGKQYDSGTKLHGTIQSPDYDIRSDVTDSSTFSYVIPNAADIIVAFSCPLGHYSWRHPERGSWFIQAICKVFNEHAYDLNIQELFTTVAREVALNYQSSTTSAESNNKKQVTSTSSTLIRTVKFAPKSHRSQNQNGHGPGAYPYPIGLPIPPIAQRGQGQEVEPNVNLSVKEVEVENYESTLTTVVDTIEIETNVTNGNVLLEEEELNANSNDPFANGNGSIAV